MRRTPPTPACHSGLKMILLLILGLSFVCGQNANSSAPSSLRLPRSMTPLKYNVTLRPFLEEDDAGRRFTFEGDVEVLLEILETTDSIVLHAKDLTFKNETIQVRDVQSNQKIAFEDWHKDEEKEFFILPMKEKLEKGKRFSLTLSYTGELLDDMKGFYRSKYQRQGKDVFLATTHFEPTDARRAFPCMDEPDFKSRFTITLKCNKKYGAISNTDLENGFPQVDRDQKIFRFKETVKMSTYLVAFVVSDFVYVEARTKTNNITVRVWGRKEAKAGMNYALEVGHKILDHYENFFGVKYPMPKQDMIAIPDFNAGAMENWGLITYRETALLHNPGEHSLRDKIWVGTVVAHELGHQWFGNLVTMRWWDDLWLNEGFACFMEYVGQEKVEPSLLPMQRFITWTLQSVLQADALTSSHPIYQKVEKPEEINSLFDSISYDKGASLIRMMRFFLGEKTFKSGLTKYLKTMSYGNAVSNDLWNSLSMQAKEDGADLNVSSIMQRWTNQMGFPVIQVTRAYDGNSVTFSQQRFLLKSHDSSTAAARAKKTTTPTTTTTTTTTTWDVPITLTTADDPNWNSSKAQIHWLPSSMAKLTLSVACGASAWIVANLEQMGYFRVNYDVRNWDLIADQLASDHKRIGVENRAQIVDDAFNLALVGLLPYPTALGLITYMNQETDYIPWGAAITELEYLGERLRHNGALDHYNKFMRKLGSKLFNVLMVNSKDESPSTVLLRPVIMTSQCRNQNQVCLRRARHLLSKRLWDKQKVNPDLRTAIYCYGIKSGTVKMWDAVLQEFRGCENPGEKQKLMKALACSEDKAILKRLLNMSLANVDIRKQDAESVISSVSKNPEGQDLAWDFVRETWPTLMTFFGGSSFTLAKLIKDVTQKFDTEEKLAEVRDFIAAHPDLGAAARALQQAVETVDFNVNWMQLHLKTVSRWFKKAEN